MSKRGIIKRDRRSSGSATWLVTFSDMMSLLLTFFILLYSMSVVDGEKFKNITYSLQQILAGESGISIIDEGDLGNIPLEDLSKVPSELENLYQQINTYIEGKDLDANVDISKNKRGVFVDIKGAILFESGSAELKESGVKLLEDLKDLLTSIDNKIVVEGHTDDVPTNSRIHPTNWELSTARAVTVVRYLAEVESIDPTRLSAIGYGEYSPLVPNDSVENRAENRRVNILIVFDEGGE